MVSLSPVPPTSFPITLAQAFKDARKTMGTPEIDEKDESLADIGVAEGSIDLKNWRHAVYMTMTPLGKEGLEAVSVNIRFQYRRDTGQIWSIRIMDSWKVYDCTLYGLRTRWHLEEFCKELGAPKRTAPQTKAMDNYFWIKGKVGYRIEIFNKQIRDVGVVNEKGEAASIGVCDLEIAPPGVKQWFEGT